MEIFHRSSADSQQPFTVYLDDIVPGADPLDDYREGILEFEDGIRYRTTFWRDPKEGQGPNGLHWAEEPGMVIVPDLTPDFIFAVIDDLVKRRAVEDGFEREQ